MWKSWLQCWFSLVLTGRTLSISKETVKKETRHAHGNSLLLLKYGFIMFLRAVFTEEQWGAQTPTYNSFSIHRCMNCGKFALFSCLSWILKQISGINEQKKYIILTIYASVNTSSLLVQVPHFLSVNTPLRTVIPPPLKFSHLDREVLFDTR